MYKVGKGAALQNPISWNYRELFLQAGNFL